MSRRTRLIAVLLAVLADAFWYYLRGPRAAPDGQAPFTRLHSANLDAFRSEFNAHADKVRVFVLLSPT